MAKKAAHINDKPATTQKEEANPFFSGQVKYPAQKTQDQDSQAATLNIVDDEVITLAQNSGPTAVPAKATLQAAPQDEKPRKDYVFIMGAKGGFYIAARRFFKDHHPEANMVSLKDFSLAGIFAKLRALASDDAPVGNLYIVSHANQDGTLSFKLSKKDKDSSISFGELKQALIDQPDLFSLNGGIDEKTKIHIKGCNIGRNEAMLNTLDEAFGGGSTVDAPTHKQGYEYHQEGKGKDKKIVSTEFFNSYVVEFPGKADKSTEELIDAFKEKYAHLNFSRQDWEIAVLGAKKYNKNIDTGAAKDKKDVDKKLGQSLKELDKKDADYKAQVKDLKDQAKLDKTGISDTAKAAKATKVAKGSKGAAKKVDKKFSATLFKGKRAPEAEADIMLAARKWFPKYGKKTWDFTAASVEKSTSDGQDHFSYTITAEKKDGTEHTLSYKISQPAFPENDQEATTLAQELFDKEVAKKPGWALARPEQYLWRIDRTQKKGTHQITAYLEMTAYAIDLDLKKDTGDKIDPAKVEKDTNFYGTSDFE